MTQDGQLGLARVFQTILLTSRRQQTLGHGRGGSQGTKLATACGGALPVLLETHLLMLLLMCLVRLPLKFRPSQEYRMCSKKQV